MLDTDTKRRIDTARDLLVGKVPDPKSQVEQITIALIYKFMDDMDAEAEELGGKRKFFSGDYGKYGWAKLMQPGIGGHELLALYADGIAKMPENPGIPALFRDIFKNAYLPYRDPETLKSFLKVINDCSYDLSERLGVAFEYLLSVLGSQGDAGQFRTPRHIIDFIVEILAPRKEESLLDPACGTAGFLISAYKHILRTNTDARGNSTLTPDEKGRLAKKFNGYDISPDMVRLSLVNLYLHGFTDPHIFEYDSLTDTARWNEYADVILANPPFMSPKGGIRPHNRFSIQAKRSEVLFVDYIAEHLTPNGRAGIIVPEGIIFQSQNAYKDLRKMLVENSLVAVISLPAGCFNPYSGVKTSILLLEKSLARQSDTIAFFKVENDGYDLGAQRRPIQKNDLPKVQEELESYLATLRERKDPSELALTTALIVPKEKIAANGDYNLSCERYREQTKAHNSGWPRVSLSSVCESVLNGCWGEDPGQDEVECFALKVSDVNSDGTIDYADATPRSVKASELDRNVLRNGDILVVKSSGSASRVVSGKCAPFKNPDGRKYVPVNFILTIRVNEEVAYSELIYRYLASPYAREHVLGIVSGATYPNLKRDEYLAFQIPLPPLEIQKEIVAEIEGYQKVINGARAVLDNYRPHIPINPDWPMVKIGEICTIERGASPRPINDFMTDEADGVNWIKIGDAEVGGKYITSTKERVTPAGAAKSRRVKPGDFILSNSMSFGRPYIMATDGCIHDGWLLLRDHSERINQDFLYNILGSSFVYDQFSQAATGGVVNNLNSEIVRGVKIPLPPLAEQQAIVAEIEAEQALVNANRELITRFEAKIQTTLSRIWGDESLAS